jgi:hypothetical protein
MQAVLTLSASATVLGARMLAAAAATGGRLDLRAASVPLCLDKARCEWENGQSSRDPGDM